MTSTEKVLNIYQRLHAIMKDVSYIQKDQKKINNNYTSVKNDDVVALLRQPLVDQMVMVVPHVLSSSQEGNRTIAEVQVDFVCVDNPVDFLRVTYYGHGVDNQDKGMGKAVTYAIKYALLKVFLLETGDDADVEKHSIDYEPPKAPAPALPKLNKEQFIASYPEKKQGAVRGAIMEFAAKHGKTEEEIVSSAQEHPDRFSAALKPYIK